MADELNAKNRLLKPVLYFIAASAVPFAIVTVIRFLLISWLALPSTVTHGCGEWNLVMVGIPSILSTAVGYIVSLILGGLAYHSFTTGFYQETFARRIPKVLTIGWVLMGFPIFLISAIVVETMAM
jgi:hypothetical protein